MSSHQPIEPFCVRINEAARMIGIGRTKLYELITDGELETVKIGKATRVTTASLHELVKQRRVRPMRLMPIIQDAGLAPLRVLPNGTEPHTW